MSDASFAQAGGSKSQLGYIIKLGLHSAPVFSYSHKAESVSLSSTQSEADALVECLKDTSWFYGFLMSIKINTSLPVLILVDNKGVTILAQDGNHLKRSRHFVIKTAYIKEQQELGIVNIQYVSGVDNTSDILTKALSGYLLRRHTAGILGHDLVEDVQRPEEICHANMVQED
jgi:hypothetical protein